MVSGLPRMLTRALEPPKNRTERVLIAGEPTFEGVSDYGEPNRNVDYAVAVQSPFDRHGLLRQ